MTEPTLHERMDLISSHNKVDYEAFVDENTPLNTVKLKNDDDLQPMADAMEWVSDGVKESSKEEEEKSRPITCSYVKEILWEYLPIMIFLVVVGILLAVAGILLWTNLTWQAWVTIVITVFTLAFLLKDRFPPHFILVCAMTAIMLLGIIPIEDALKGFSNDSVLTIAVLFIVAKAVEVNRALDLVIRYVLRQPKRLWEAQLRLIVPVAVFSAFLNNTPIVAMMIPVVSSWARHSKLPVSKLMMPLSYAAVLGGTWTIIGTSTNLIVAGLLNAQDPTIELGFFEIGIIGAPLFFLALLYILFFSPFLLPDRTQAMDQFLNNPREYTAAVRVEPRSVLDGVSIEKAGFRNLENVFLFQVVRDEETISAPDADFVLKGDDLLFFSGVISSMQQVYSITGVTPATNQVAKIVGRLRNRCLVEVVIAKTSPLVGQTVKEAKFRTKYNAAIIAIHRRGFRLDKSLGDIVLQAGDTLLCEAHKNFVRYHTMDQDFALVNLVGERSVWKKQKLWKTIFVVTMVATLIALNTAGLLNLLAGSLAISIIFIFTRCVKFYQAKEALQGELIILIAAAFSLGTALDQTGAATIIADSLISLLEPLGPAGILAGIYGITTILTEVISNAACVTLMFPIAWRAVETIGLNPKAMVYTLMMAGSSSFCTPIGYQTNLMVMGPGNYVFFDYVRFGLPLNILAMITTVTLASFVWPSA